MEKVKFDRVFIAYGAASLSGDGVSKFRFCIVNNDFDSLKFLDNGEILSGVATTEIGKMHLSLKNKDRKVYLLNDESYLISSAFVPDVLHTERPMTEEEIREERFSHFEYDEDKGVMVKVRDLPKTKWAKRKEDKYVEQWLGTMMKTNSYPVLTFNNPVEKFARIAGGSRMIDFLNHVSNDENREAAIRNEKQSKFSKLPKKLQDKLKNYQPCDQEWQKNTKISDEIEVDKLLQIQNNLNNIVAECTLAKKQSIYEF